MRLIFSVILVFVARAICDFQTCDVQSISLYQLSSDFGSVPRRLAMDSPDSVSVKCQAGENLLFNSLNCTEGVWTGNVVCGPKPTGRKIPQYSDPTRYYRFSRTRETSASFLGCDHSTDLLMDWRTLKSDLQAVIASGQNVDIFKDRIEPQLVRFENFFRHHKDTSFTDCVLGYVAIRAYLILVVFPFDSDVHVTDLAEHVVEIFSEYPLENVLASGWFAEIIAPVLSALRPQMTALQGASDSGVFRQIKEASDTLQALRSGTLDVADRKLKYWLGSSAAAEKFFVESIIAHANIYEQLANSRIERIEAPPACQFEVCPVGETWVSDSCKCKQVFPPVETKSGICIFVSDSRKLGDMDEDLDTLRYWQLTFRANALYANLHGYKIYFHQPEVSATRKIGWAKVRFMLETMQREVAACEYGVSIDSDAVFATNERLESAIAAFGLYRDRHFLFGEEYHQEEKADEVINANGGFFIVRNSALGLQMLTEWYDVPENFESHKQFAKDNPQGLNFCWDSKIHEKFKPFISYAHPKLFSAPYSVMVRHNWFKDQAFEHELRRAALDRFAMNEQFYLS